MAYSNNGYDFKYSDIESYSSDSFLSNHQEFID
jgi:hypothetical protein